MKKIGLAIILFFTCLFCNAQTKPSLSLSPHIGLTYGQFDEILYDSNGDQCSLLEWEQKPLLNIGLSTKLDFSRLSISTNFEFGTKIATFYMYDSDWDNGEKYSFTKHPIETAKELNTQFILTYNLVSDKILSISPVIELQYLYDSFNGGRGTGIRYGNPVKVYGIDYSKHSVIIFTGYNFGINIGSFINLQTDFLISPYIYQYATDFHHGVLHPFTAVEIQQANFSKFKINGKIKIKITSTFSIDLYTHFLFGYTTKGELYSNYWTEEITKFLDQQSGANFYSIKFGIGTTSIHF